MTTDHDPGRRAVLLTAGAAIAALALPLNSAVVTANEGNRTMSTITTQDDVEIFYKDWGPMDAQPIVFHHGWPLSGDDWDAQMLFFLSKGYRVIAHDRRGHGRSQQVSDGHDITQPTSQRLSALWICATRSTSATRLVAVRLPGMSRGLRPAALPRPC